jgi:PPOX class probable FMN-dependent enzyme
MLAGGNAAMSDTGFAKIVSSEQQLRDVLGHPGERAVLKQQSRLDEHFRAFIAGSPFLLLGTANAAGQCDVSPKGDEPGFVKVLDETHLAIPDRIGNNRLDGMRNILQNGHVGLLFLIPGREDTLRVNGRAWIVQDDDLLDHMVVRGKRPPFAIGVEVEEAFMHCPRAFMRAGLWKPESWPDPTAVPSMARMLWDQVPTVRPFPTVEEYAADQRRRLQTLY